MNERNLHEKPFDEGTMAKLDLFRFYIREWLPVFIKARRVFWKTLNIYDFFSGPGQDVNGIKGTPLIILEELEPYFKDIQEKGISINLYFNEYSNKKYAQLKKLIEPYKSNVFLNIEIDSLEFTDSFQKKHSSLIGEDRANLLFFDQTGVKQINTERFKSIVSLKRTDFLFFISSSTIKRFVDHPGIAKYIRLDKDEVEKTPYHKIHGLVLDFYKSLVPKTKEYYLAPFSIRKKAGLYGVIFGSNNVLGIEKFLNAAWKIDSERGTANFDIDNDNIVPGQLDIFTGEIPKPKKIDKDVYLYTLDKGMKISFGRKVLNSLIRQGVIEKDKYELSNKVCKKNSIINQIKFK
jgi:three-Cys-motif partner protein